MFLKGIVLKQKIDIGQKFYIRTSNPSAYEGVSVL